MSRRRMLYGLLTAALVGCLLAFVVAPATAVNRTLVLIHEGQRIEVIVDVPSYETPAASAVPAQYSSATVVGFADAPPPPQGNAPAPDAAGAPDPEETPAKRPEDPVEKLRDADPREKPKSKDRDRRRGDRKKSRPKREGGSRRKAPSGGLRAKPGPLRRPDGSPSRSNPTFSQADPLPSQITGIPNFTIRQFEIPLFLLPIYEAAGSEYGIDWEVLAAINDVETNYGRNLNVSTAGALGWMQFMPATWRQYGVDANGDNRKDPYNPYDAIFAAARYLRAAGGHRDIKRAIFAYNHANWYVDLVVTRTRVIKGMPPDLTGSLSGLASGRFPVYAKARYADNLTEKDAKKKFKPGQNAANVISDKPGRERLEIFTREGAPVVAVQDGIVKKIGRSAELGRYVVLQDAFGNRYTYAGLDSVAKQYPVPKSDPDPSTGLEADARPAVGPEPSMPATDGRQLDASDEDPFLDGPSGGSRYRSADSPRKERLFAHPDRPNARRAGGVNQLLAEESGPVDELDGFTTFRNYFSRAFGLKAEDARLKRLRRGSRVIGGTILGRVGRPEEDKAAFLDFRIRPAGEGAPYIDPKPIVDGWRLLEATAIYRAAGRNALRGTGMSIGRILLMPKLQLEQRVLNDERIDVYPCGRKDIRSGQIDRRVLAALAYLAESGLRPTVTSLKCGHGFYTASGNVSNHSYGSAVDIAKINGTSILGHQERGGVTHQAVKRLLRLQGTMEADELISLLDLGGPSFAMGDHADHIHLGYRPLFGRNRKLGKQVLQVMKPGQWEKLVDRLGQIDNPTVRQNPSKYSIPVRRRASRAHRGE